MSYLGSHLLICENCEDQFSPDDYEDCPTRKCAYCELSFCEECFEETKCSYGTEKDPHHSEYVSRGA